MGAQTPTSFMFTPEHVLSEKSVRQQRNVFIWCGRKVVMGPFPLLFDLPFLINARLAC